MRDRPGPAATGFAVEQRDAGRPVSGVGRRERAHGEDPGLGLDRDVGFEPVAVLADGLVHVTGIAIDRRDHPVRGDPPSDPPRSFLITRFDVLASDQGEQPDRVALLGAELHAADGIDDGAGVVDQPGDQRRLRVGVVPRTHRFARLVVVMGRHLDRGDFGNQAASSSSVESNARRFLPFSTPRRLDDSSDTPPKIRSGRCD